MFQPKRVLEAGWARISIGAIIVATAAFAEFAQGRMLWGKQHEPGLWSGQVWSSHNSQYMFDPYSFTHITHGVLLYGLTWLTARSQPRGIRALFALAIEAAFEMIENSDFVIQRYRAATMSLDYYGDSVMNSMCDIFTCMVGFTIAALLPARAAAVLVIALELALALWIRDGLLLNVVMLIRPIPAILKWQMATRH